MPSGNPIGSILFASYIFIFVWFILSRFVGGFRAERRIHMREKCMYYYFLKFLYLIVLGWSSDLVSRAWKFFFFLLSQ